MHETDHKLTAALTFVEKYYSSHNASRQRRRGKTGGEVGLLRSSAGSCNHVVWRSTIIVGGTYNNRCEIEFF